MNPTITRRAALRTALALSACTLLRPAHACEFFTTNLRIYHPWTRATAPGLSLRGSSNSA